MGLDIYGGENEEKSASLDVLSDIYSATTQHQITKPQAIEIIAGLQEVFGLDDKKDIDSNVDECIGEFKKIRDILKGYR